MSWNWEFVDGTYLVSFRMLVGCIFLIAGIAKLIDVSPFKRTLQNMGLPRAFVSMAILVPTVELAVGGWLLTGVAIILAAVLALAVLSVFTAALILVLLKGTETDCNCFGPLAQRQTAAAAVYRNICLLGVSVLVLLAGNASAFTTAGSLVASTIVASVPLICYFLGNKTAWFLSISTIPTAVRSSSPVGRRS